ncbi:MAG: 2-amino-4-hydroxy-6-hydroxymethyldihydropteridine diphosphokinase [Hyphomicrobiales bacterium]|nr:2-amino-4-hydroxy-6-hydroxymethyldihydropteridine diphosphokinase [Hyphomicrobiales bacterium]
MILIGFGSNMTGLWGLPASTLYTACKRLQQAGVRIRAFSPLYETTPLGPEQPTYVNAAARIETALTPFALLSVLKRLEREAGRRPGKRWGPRPLDIDILDCRGLIVNWRLRPRPTPNARARLVLPHAGLHERPFALAPVAAVAPRWTHPVWRKPAGALLARLKTRDGAVIRRP